MCSNLGCIVPRPLPSSEDDGEIHHAIELEDTRVLTLMGDINVIG